MSRVVIVGLATDYCVQATALDARLRGYPATVLAAGIRAVELAAGDGARAIDAMRQAGVEVVRESSGAPGRPSGAPGDPPGATTSQATTPRPAH